MLDFLAHSLSPLGAVGSLSLLLALGFAVYALIAGVSGGLRGDARLTDSARYAVWGNFAFMTVAISALQYGILTDDFSVRYVANHSMTLSPTWVKWVTLWAALEGSVLLWGWILSLYAFVVSLTARRDVLRPWVFATMAVSLIFFIGINLTVASPFTPVVQPPLEGRGPNPLLQNHWMMAVHPVLMYLGFVGLSVPFAYAVAALITGRLGESWIVQTRRWTLLAWIMLSAAIVSGGWWAYEVLGWGGYWAWDPVENASLIPWLLATAFLHSVQIQERRRILKSWNVHLIVLAYAATVLGTFLTRSGVVESVHAFGDGPVGPAFLGFFGLLTVLGLGLAAWRAGRLRDPHSLDAALSREGAVLGGNVLLTTFAALVLLGTLFPVLVEALSGARTAVGAPFYNFFAVPLGLLILLFMGVGPLLPWRRLGVPLMSLLRAPALLGLGALVLALALGVRSPWLAICVGLVAFNLVGLFGLTARAARERGGLTALPGLLRGNPRRYGAYLAHAGIAVMALGIGFSSTYFAKQEITLRVGQPQAVLGRQVEMLSLTREQEPHRVSSVATVRMNGDTLQPRVNLYAGQPQAVPMPAVRYHLLGDSYVTMLASVPDEGWATVAVYSSPLVSWIWVGTGLLLLGTFFSIQAPARELPQLAPAARPGVTA